MHTTKRQKNYTGPKQKERDLKDQPKIITSQNITKKIKEDNHIKIIIIYNNVFQIHRKRETRIQ